MAVKRMISNDVVRTTLFQEMSQGAQLLYFFLNLSADDDGFNNDVMAEMERTKATKEDLSQLLRRGFIYAFESGVIVVRDWLINNNVPAKQYKPSEHIKEKFQLGAGNKGKYELIDSLPEGAKSIPLLQYEKGNVPLAARDLINENNRLQYISLTKKLGDSKNVQFELDNCAREDKSSLDKKRGECVHAPGAQVEMCIPEVRTVIDVDEFEIYSDETPNADTQAKCLYGEMKNIFLFDEEFQKLSDTYEDLNTLIDNVSHYLVNTNNKYSSHYSLIRRIAIKDKWPQKSNHTNKNEFPQNKFEEEKNSIRNEEITEIMETQMVDFSTAENIYKKECEEVKNRVLEKYRKLFGDKI